MTTPIIAWQVLSKEQIKELFDAITKRDTKKIVLVTQDLFEQTQTLTKLNEKIALLEEKERDLERPEISLDVKKAIKIDIASHKEQLIELRSKLKPPPESHFSKEKAKNLPIISNEDLTWFFRQQPIIKALHTSCLDRLSDMPGNENASAEYKQVAKCIGSMQKTCHVLNSIYSAFLTTKENEKIAEEAAQYFFIAKSDEEPKPFQLFAPKFLSLAYGDEESLCLTSEEQAQIKQQLDDTDRACMEGVQEAVIAIEYKNLYYSLFKNTLIAPDKATQNFLNLANNALLLKRLSSSENEPQLTLILQEMINVHEDKENIHQFISSLNSVINDYSSKQDNEKSAQCYISHLKQLALPLTTAIGNTLPEEADRDSRKNQVYEKITQSLNSTINTLNQADQSLSDLSSAFEENTNKAVVSNIYSKMSDLSSYTPMKTRVEQATAFLSENKEMLKKRKECTGFVDSTLRYLKLAAYTLTCSTIIGAAAVYAVNGTLKFWQQPKRRQALMCAKNDLKNLNNIL